MSDDAECYESVRGGLLLVSLLSPNLHQTHIPDTISMNQKSFKLLAILGLLCLGGQEICTQSPGYNRKYCLPHEDTYAEETFVIENELCIIKPEVQGAEIFAEARQILPVPLWKGYDEEDVEMCRKAWEISQSNRKFRNVMLHVEGVESNIYSGFVLRTGDQGHTVVETPRKHGCSIDAIGITL